MELNQAWEVLREVPSRKAYDEQWKHEKEAAMTPYERGEMYRRKGNAMYVEARDIQKSHEGKMSFSATRESMAKFTGAIELYSKALELVAFDHRLWSNRALCYAALEDWRRCKEDAMRCAKMRPDFMKGWFLLVKALWKLGEVEDALRELESGLRSVPDSRELLELRTEIAGEAGDPCFNASFGRQGSRSLSPGITPRQVGGGTPPQSFRHMGATAPAPSSSTPQRSGSTSPGPTSPPRRSPSLAAAAAASARVLGEWVSHSRQGSRSPGPGGGAQSRQGSKSPGPAGNRSRHDLGVTVDMGQSGAFGMPTPCFAGAPPHPSMGLNCSMGSTLQGGHSFAGTRGATPPRR